MKTMQFLSALQSVLLFALLVICPFTADAAVTMQKAHAGKMLRSAAHSQVKKHDDDQEGSDDDDDDDDDEDDDTPSSAKLAAIEKKKVDPEKARLQKAVAEAEADLAQNLAEQKKLKYNIKHLSDVASSQQEIEADAKLVAKETDSAQTAKFLAGMWKEMRMFELPGYKKHAEEELVRLRHQQSRIEDDVAAAQAAVSAGNKVAPVKKETSEEAPAVAKAAVVPPEDAATGVEQAQDKTVEASVLHRWSVWHMDSKQQKNVFYSSLVYLVFGVCFAFIYKQARVKGAFQPSPRHTAVAPRKEFSFGLFGCFGDPNVCVVGCCCPYLRWADTVDRKGLLKYWWAFLIMFSLMMLHVYTMGISTIIACIIGITYRQKLRRKYGLDAGSLSTIGYDMLAWVCCQPCAIIQEAREEAVPHVNDAML